LKLGLANIAVVVALAVADGATAVVVSLGRVVIVGLATGTLGTPVGLIAGAGAMSSVAVMWSLSSRGDVFSLIGWSAAGSAAHVVAQLLVAGLLMGSWSLMALTPVSILIALPLGALTGCSPVRSSPASLNGDVTGEESRWRHDWLAWVLRRASSCCVAILMRSRTRSC